MVRNIMVAGLLVAAVVAIGSAAPLRPEAPKTGSPEDADFTGKIVAVSVPDPVRGAFLQNARVKRLGGRMFLVGDSVKQGPDDESPDAVYWFPVEDLTLIREYKSLEDLKKDFVESAKQFKAAKEGK